MNPETAEPDTAATENGLQVFEQLDGRLELRNSGPSGPAPGRRIPLQIICMLNWIAELVCAAGPR
jgi:hypothetical protein